MEFSQSRLLLFSIHTQCNFINIQTYFKLYFDNNKLNLSTYPISRSTNVETRYLKVRGSKKRCRTE